jgi:N-methylhydantoinase A
VVDTMRNELLQRLEREGYAPSAIHVQNLLDLRYRGQSAEITVPLPGELTEHSLREAEERFEQEFERTYGHRGQARRFELVTCRVIASVARSAEHTELWAADRSASRPETARDAYFGERLGTLRTAVVSRASLQGPLRRGPLIVQEYDTSVVVPPGCSAALDAHGNIVLDIGSDAAG